MSWGDGDGWSAPSCYEARCYAKQQSEDCVSQKDEVRASEEEVREDGTWCENNYRLTECPIEYDNITWRAPEDDHNFSGWRGHAEDHHMFTPSPGWLWIGLYLG